jgi:hypothetical protein
MTVITIINPTYQLENHGPAPFLITPLRDVYAVPACHDKNG